MIDTDKYEEVFKEYPVSDYWPQMKRIQAHGIRALNEIKRLRGIAKTCLEAIEAGGDMRSGTIELIEHNLKLMEMVE